MSKAEIQKFMRARRAELRKPPKRKFPGGICLNSTRAYVEAYWQMNGLTNNYALSLTVGAFFEPLNTAPTTWPEPEVESPMDDVNYVGHPTHY